MPNQLDDFDEKSESKKMTILWMALMEIYPKVMRHEEILITGGAHSVPLPEQVRTIVGYIDNLKYWGRFIGGALVLQTFAFLFTVIVAIVRFLPVLERIAAQP